MASINGVSHVNGNTGGRSQIQEPPSSTLAAHLKPVNGDGQSRFDKSSFNILLEEALGYDESGQPNLGDDIDVNQTLIRVIFEAGIDPVLTKGKDNPFGASAIGSNESQLVRCLQVVRLAIERCPRVLFATVSQGTTHSEPQEYIFFEWLLPKLCLQLTHQSATPTPQEQSARDAILVAVSQASRPSGNTLQKNPILSFLLCYCQVILEQLHDCDSAFSTSDMFTPKAVVNGSSNRFSLPSTRVERDHPQATSLQFVFVSANILAIVAQFLANEDLIYTAPNSGLLSQLLCQFRLLWQDLLLPAMSDPSCVQAMEALFYACSKILDGITKISQTYPLPSYRKQCCGTFMTVLSDIWNYFHESDHPHVFEAFTDVLDIAARAAILLPPLQNLIKEAGRSWVLSVLRSSDPHVLDMCDRFRRLIDLLSSDSNPPDSCMPLGPSRPEESDWTDEGRARKRLRLSTELSDEAVISRRREIYRDLTAALCGHAVNDLSSLSQMVGSYFHTLDGLEKSKALHMLGRTACLLDSTETILQSPVQLPDDQCALCGSSSLTKTWHVEIESADAVELVRTLTNIAAATQKTTELRVAALFSLRRVLLHTNFVETLDLSQSRAGEWVMQSLRSSNRDIRLAAIQVLPAFVLKRGHIPSTLTHSNRVFLLDFLQNFWARNELPMQETVVLALTTIGQVVGDEELNIIVVRLVEYLGHGNPYINGFVYSELQRLAEGLHTTVTKMLPPFWRTIAVVVIRNLNTRPAIAQQICDLLGWSMDGLLVRMSDHALPYLVLSKKRETIERIAAAHDPPTTTFHVCTQRAALKNILTLLLTQGFPDPEETIMALLLHVSPDFEEHDLATWLGLESTPIACELLMTIADAGQGRGSRQHQALHSFTQLLLRKPVHSSSSRKYDSVGTFLENSSLAIINQFIFVLSTDETREPPVEKRRALAAVGELARIGKSKIVDALPQICACLRSAIESENFCDTAFSSWAAMIEALRDEEAEPLVDQTVAIIVRKWEALSTDSRQLADKLMADLAKSHPSAIQNVLSTVPSTFSIPSIAKIEAEMNLKGQTDDVQHFVTFARRLRNESTVVIEQALTELALFLDSKHELLHRSILQEQPDIYVQDLTRALLDCCLQFKDNPDAARLCGECLGQIGCLDPNRIEAPREKKTIVVLDNFSKAGETVDFVIFFLEKVLVKAFLSAPSTRAQGFLAWAMQELLKLCSLDDAVALRSRTSGSSATYRRWLDLPEGVRNTLTPFLTSKYLVQEIQPPSKCEYPLFKAGKMNHSTWLRTLTLDFLHRGPGINTQMIFSICCRIISGQDLAIPSFLLPYASLNLVISGAEPDKDQIVQEMLTILRLPFDCDSLTQEDIRLCSETVFDILDYMFNWLQQKRKHSALARARSERGVADPLGSIDQDQMGNVEAVLSAIPADLMSRRAIDCKSYARALFNWENHMRQHRADNSNEDKQLSHLQEIYAQIDEPDGIEGISSRMQVLDIEQQVLEHRKAARWTAAQSWYEMQLVQDPCDTDAQINLLQCLRESGQHDVLLHHLDGLDIRDSLSAVAPYAVEAAWLTGKWDKLTRYLSELPKNSGNFNVGLATIMSASQQKDTLTANSLLDELERTVALALTTNSTSSLQACHDSMLKLHVLRDVRDVLSTTKETRSKANATFNTRLDVLGSYVADKQYVLGVRRAVMTLVPTFTSYEIAATWLASARLARKAALSNQAFSSILHASSLGEKSATIEQAKLMWQEGYHRKAIQTLEGAIDAGLFDAHNIDAEEGPLTLTTEQRRHQNEVTAKAYVLLGKWLDSAGQTASDIIIKTFRKAADHNRRWEKGHYYLGKYYNKILDSERHKELGKESQAYLTGEAAKVVIENYLRAATVGSKYVFQTLPKMLTLWLELVATSEQSLDPRRGNEKFQAHSSAQRKVVVATTHKQVKKYTEKLLPITLYTILPQLVARICHTNNTVHEILESMIMKIVTAYPQQALWSLLATTKSYSKDRQTRGLNIIRKISEETAKSSKKNQGSEFRSMVHAGQRLFDELLRVSDFTIEGKTPRVSLARDLGFNHKIAPSRLVVPVETCLIPSLPTSFEPSVLKNFRAFAREPVTINAFLDDAMVLASLQKPRRLSIRGSDGNMYGVLAKPKDDLRKDQRLMEFNTMINRLLKRDVEASKRRLYIRTYAVVPLNEECGLIEWVDNLKTFRDILLKLYKERNISPNYVEIRNLLDEACAGPAQKVDIFPNRILNTFPPIFYEWFIESFPDPTAWFNARLRYTRSAAVMSMVGHVLGLGDRHGENILFEEDNGGTFHVDFNCLFDKGLTFEKPECIPFRLTHNMVDAFGAYGYEGPFRRCCEITLALLRNNEDALMTILETFLHDPTTDFISAAKRKKNAVPGVPDSPIGILDSVRGKVRGMLPGESVPLSVGGYVDEMIKQAVDPARLCRMYIGWCAFF